MKYKTKTVRILFRIIEEMGIKECRILEEIIPSNMIGSNPSLNIDVEPRWMENFKAILGRKRQTFLAMRAVINTVGTCERLRVQWPYVTEPQEKETCSQPERRRIIDGIPDLVMDIGNAIYDGCEIHAASVGEHLHNIVMEVQAPFHPWKDVENQMAIMFHAIGETRGLDIQFSLKPNLRFKNEKQPMSADGRFTKETTL